MAHTTTSQIGPNAVAPPAVKSYQPAVPGLYHLQDKAVAHNDNTPNTQTDPAGATAEEESDLTFPGLPPFPDDAPTAPLLRISLRKLVDRDPDEVERLWRTSCDVGFFYLDLRGVVAGSKRDSGAGVTDSEGQVDGEGLLKDAEALFELGERVFDLPSEEKGRYDFKDRGSYFGYKGLGANVVDSRGTRDANEFYNISKDDILGLGEPLPAPHVLQQHTARALLKSYMTRSHAVVALLLALLNDKLALPPGTLPTLHRLHGASGDQVRWVRSPPQPQDERRLALGEHTDYGSLTILFNRLGGLQILPPDPQTKPPPPPAAAASSSQDRHHQHQHRPSSSQWQYVRPLRGHAVCNLGDALVKFTAGVLRSNLHRVVNPPGAQQALTRMSLVYFARPEDEVVLKPLEGSGEIDAKLGATVSFAGAEHVTAKEWVLTRAMGKRVGGDWEKSMGTEAGRGEV